MFRRNRNQFFKKDNLVPLAKELGISSVVGFSSGLFIRELGNKFIFVVGGIFVAL